MKNIIYPELSYDIVGAAMDVHNDLGPGWDEEAYHLAMLEALTLRGLEAHSKVRKKLMQRDIIADRFILDIIVDDKIVLELKHLVNSFAAVHYLQIINYLKCWDRELGLLINFGLNRLQYERVPFMRNRMVAGEVELYDDVPVVYVLDVAKTVLNDHGLGYSGDVYRKLFKAECRYRQIDCDMPVVELAYNDKQIGKRRVNALCLNNEVLIIVSALEKEPSAVDKARLSSYLRCTGLQSGVIVNYGRHSLQLCPVSAK